MAWEARSGLKHRCLAAWRDEHCCGRNGLGSPFGIETSHILGSPMYGVGRNGLGSPFGIETDLRHHARWTLDNVGMAWEARSGLKLLPFPRFYDGQYMHVGMAWEARSGLKRLHSYIQDSLILYVGMAWEARSGLKPELLLVGALLGVGRNGLGSPFGIETQELAAC